MRCSRFLPHLNSKHQVLILCGDVPLISSDTLSHFVASTGLDQLGLLTATVDNPTGLGRIIYDEYHQVAKIVEEKDASDLERQIKEINAGIYCAPGKYLHSWLPKLGNNNAQDEYYLTDVVAFARDDHIGVSVSHPKAIAEIYGANSRAELAKLERIYQYWQAEKLMASGVSLIDPARVDIRGTVKAGYDSEIDVNVIFEGMVELGENCIIGANVILRNVKIGNAVTIYDNSIIENAVIEDNANVGPFARIRPDTIIKSDAKVGNFVEIKKSTIGKGSKVNHLSYIGDSKIGNNVNIGAGVITCNYDGVNKHQTIIEDNAFIGSNAQLIAPVKLVSVPLLALAALLIKMSQQKRWA